MHSAECRTTVPLKFVTIIHNYANVWTIKKLLPGFLVITSLHGINNDSSIQTGLREQATRRYVWNSGCFAVQQHFSEAISEFEENEEMLNSEMEGGGVGDSVVSPNYPSVTDIGMSGSKRTSKVLTLSRLKEIQIIHCPRRHQSYIGWRQEDKRNQYTVDSR